MSRNRSAETILNLREQHVERDSSAGRDIEHRDPLVLVGQQREGQVVGLAELRELSRSNGENVLQHLVDTFLSELPARLATLKSALDADDLKALGRAAHAMRSAAGRLSPVIIRTRRIPSDRRFAKSSRTFARTVSEKKIAPRSFPSCATETEILPCS